MPTIPADPSSPDLARRSRIIERIERDAGVQNLADILAHRLAPTDLQSLLLEVYARRAESHRLLRGQKFGVGPGTRQHFRILTLCSAGRDSGSLLFETETIGLHIGFYLAALKQFLGTKTALRVAISDFGSTVMRPVIRSGVIEKLQSAHRKVSIGIDQGRKQGRGYYGQLSFKIFATPSEGLEHELVDGGDVDWTKKLLNNAKERLIISGCGSERLCELFGLGHALKEDQRF